MHLSPALALGDPPVRPLRRAVIRVDTERWDSAVSPILDCTNPPLLGTRCRGTARRRELLPSHAGQRTALPNRSCCIEQGETSP